MTIGFFQLELYLPNTHSLKDKRSIITRIRNLVRNKFNVSIAELDYHDKWGKALVGILTLNSDKKIVLSTLNRAEKFIEANFDVQVVGSKIEIL